VTSSRGGKRKLPYAFTGHGKMCLADQKLPPLAAEIRQAKNIGIMESCKLNNC